MNTALETLARLSSVADDLGRQHASELQRLDETAAAKRALELLGSAGLCAWMVPRAFGGADAGALVPADTISVRAACVLRRSLAYHSAMLDVMLVMQGLGSFALTQAADLSLAREILPRVATGQICAAFALTEPGAGSSLTDIALRATRNAHGWKLSGHKTFISNAGIADFYTVLARSGDEPAHY